MTLPTEQQGVAVEGNAQDIVQKEGVNDARTKAAPAPSSRSFAKSSPTPKSTKPVHSASEAPATENTVEKHRKEATRPTTSTSDASVSESAGRSTTPRSAIPVVPVVPAVPKSSPKAARASTADKATEDSRAAASQAEEAEATAADPGASDQPQQEEKASPKPAARRPVSSWSALFARPGASASKSQSGADGSSHGSANGVSSAHGGQAANGDAARSPGNASPISAALRAYRVGTPQKIKFIEPRGLINIGNMCYMNSVGFCQLRRLFAFWGLTFGTRFFKFFFTVSHFTISWTKSLRGCLSASRARRPF